MRFVHSALLKELEIIEDEKPDQNAIFLMGTSAKDLW
jgi:hypothetical protein